MLQGKPVESSTFSSVHLGVLPSDVPWTMDLKCLDVSRVPTRHATRELPLERRFCKVSKPFESPNITELEA